MRTYLAYFNYVSLKLTIISIFIPVLQRQFCLPADLKKIDLLHLAFDRRNLPHHINESLACRDLLSGRHSNKKNIAASD